MVSSTLQATQLTVGASSCPCGREQVGLLWAGRTPQSGGDTVPHLEGKPGMKDFPEGMRVGLHGVRMWVKG